MCRSPSAYVSYWRKSTIPLVSLVSCVDPSNNKQQAKLTPSRQRHKKGGVKRGRCASKITVTWSANLPTPAEMRVSVPGKISELRWLGFCSWKKFFRAVVPGQLSTAGPFVVSVAHAAARPRASGMAITGTVAEPRQPSSFGASSNR